MKNQDNTTPRQLVTVTKTQAHFDSLKWLAKALSKDETRYPLKFIHCEVDGDDVTLVTVDGRRLHKLQTTTSKLPGMASGGYSIKISAREILLIPEPGEKVGNFPNWRQVIPDYDNHPTPPEVIRETVGVEKNKTASNVTAVLNAANNGVSISGDKPPVRQPIIFNDQFLSDALGQGTLFGAKGKALWRCETVQMSPLVITLDKVDNLQAVIMPMRA
jgi:hypothetical protein